ncbi:MAG TPA: DUF5677 domain-containing protein [Candidatus Saccharimonadales bacterium]|nr:DUF5677 domain-containing protein [Candidatus Saccharimonadales bacterium]
MAKTSDKLDNFRKLLDYGATKLQSFDGKNTKDMTDRQVFLLASFAAVHSYADGIFWLLEKGSVAASNVLLRSIVENYINTHWLLSDPEPEKNIRYAQFGFEDTQKELDLFHFIKKFRKDNPDFDTGEFTDEKLKELIDKRKAEIAQLIAVAGEDVKTVPRIYQRAQQADADSTHLPDGHRGGVYWQYLLVYSHLCNATHLGSRGLDPHLADSSGQQIFSMEARTFPAESITNVAYVYYVTLLDFLVSEHGIKDEQAMQDFTNVVDAEIKQGKTATVN